jgi:hypothetical protein
MLASNVSAEVPAIPLKNRGLEAGWSQQSDASNEATVPDRVLEVNDEMQIRQENFHRRA